MTMASCVLCFNEFDEEGVPCHPPKLRELCCKYLHSSLTQETLCQSSSNNMPAFCLKCFESLVELGELNDQLKFYQKRTAEFVFILSLEILHRRGNSSNIYNRPNHGTTLLEFDVSSLPNCDFKNTIVSEEIESETKINFNSKDFNCPTLVISTTPNNANSVEFTLEKIKVDTDEHNRIEDETNDEVDTIENIDNSSFVAKANEIISSGCTGNNGLVPMLKLQRLNFRGNDGKVILIGSDQDDLNRSNGSIRSQTMWTKSDFGNSFKITDKRKNSATGNCLEDFPRVPSTSASNIPGSSSNITNATYAVENNTRLTQPNNDLLCSTTLPKEESQVHIGGHSGDNQIDCYANTNRFKKNRRSLKSKNNSSKNPVKRKQAVEKRFKCDICGYASYSSWNLKKHNILRHSNFKHFKCRECKKDFKIKELVKQHYKHVHFALQFSDDCVLKN